MARANAPAKSFFSREGTDIPRRYSLDQADPTTAEDENMRMDRLHLEDENAAGEKGIGNGDEELSELNLKITTIYSDFMTRVTIFEELVSAGSRFLVGFQQALGYLQRPVIDKTSSLVKQILEANRTERFSSYIEAGCMKTDAAAQSVVKSKAVVDELRCLLDDAASIMQTTNEKCEGAIRNYESSITSSTEEVPSSDLLMLKATDCASTMAVVYSMVKQDYEMQVLIVSSIGLTSSPGERLDSYCQMWTLRPYVDDGVIVKAWELIPKY